jgi:hypothetical protein
MSILALALAYVFLLFMVTLAILKSDLGVGLKLVLVSLCLGFYLWHYNALQDSLGWPAASGIPQNFELISSFTVEPDPKRDEPGSIYVWLRDLDSDRLLPRSFRLPYQQQQHRQIEDTMQRQQQGERFIGRPRVRGSGGIKTEIEFEAVQRDSRSHKASPE